MATSHIGSCASTHLRMAGEALRKDTHLPQTSAISAQVPSFCGSVPAREALTHLVLWEVDVKKRSSGKAGVPCGGLPASRHIEFGLSSACLADGCSSIGQTQRSVHCEQGKRVLAHQHQLDCGHRDPFQGIVCACSPPVCPISNELHMARALRPHDRQSSLRFRCIASIIRRSDWGAGLSGNRCRTLDRAATSAMPTKESRLWRRAI